MVHNVLKDDKGLRLNATLSFCRKEQSIMNAQVKTGDVQSLSTVTSATTGTTGKYGRRRQFCFKFLIFFQKKKDVA